MTFDRDFLEMFPQTVTLVKFAALSTDGYGARTYSTGTYSLRARVEQDRHLVKDVTGREVVSTTTVFTPPYDNSTGQVAVTINVSDKITLPSGFLVAGSSQPPIIAVSRQQDEGGDHHYEVSL